jgi:hypothetical protein
VKRDAKKRKATREKREPAKVRGFIPTPRRADEIASVVKALRLTPREDKALQRVALKTGIPWFDLVRGWIELADAGVLAPASETSPGAGVTPPKPASLAGTCGGSSTT